MNEFGKSTFRNSAKDAKELFGRPIGGPNQMPEVKTDNVDECSHDKAIRDEVMRIAIRLQSERRLQALASELKETRIAKAAVPVLIDLIRNPRPALHWSGVLLAVERLRLKQAIPALRHAVFSNGDYEYRAAAAETLCRMNGTFPIWSFKHLAKSRKSTEILCNLLRAIEYDGAFRSEAIPFIYRSFSDPNPNARINAIKLVVTLSGLNQPAADISKIIGAIDDKDKSVRMEAIKAVSGIDWTKRNATEIVPAAVGMLNDPDEEIRNSGEMLLVQLEMSATLPLIVNSTRGWRSFAMLPLMLFMNVGNSIERGYAAAFTTVFEWIDRLSHKRR